jgi:Transposase domain (DUF772)
MPTPQPLVLDYSHTGRPSIDPELMVRMLIVGYCFCSLLNRSA